MKRLMILAAVALAACGPEPDMQMQKRQWQQSRAAEPAPVSDQGRVTVERIGVFKDDLAYNDKRGVYVIRDAITGREFIGVSGVGIAETGRHSTGKSSTTDER